MGIRMNPRFQLHALYGRSPEPVPRRVRARLRAWARVLPILALLALGFVSSAAAALTTPEEGEAQLLAMLNKDREVKLRPHRVLDVLADWQACTNARRHAVEEVDELGQDFRARCLAMGLIGKTIASVTADEFYFRTTHASGGALIFDSMVEEAKAKRYDFAGVRCVRGDDGRFYWCIAFCRDERMDRLAGRHVPEPRGDVPRAPGATAPLCVAGPAPAAGRVARDAPSQIQGRQRRDQCPRPTRHSASSNVVRYGVKSTCRLTA